MGRFLARHRALAVTVLVSGIVLFLSIWPGLLSGVAFFVLFWAIVWVPLVFAIRFALRLARRGAPRRTNYEGRPPIVERLAIPAVVFVALALLLSEAPRRVAFRLSRPAFERLAATAPVGRSRVRTAWSWAGVYPVDQYAADGRGGVYFRVFAAPEGLGPDHLSYGFAKAPNHKGSPFGASNYQIGPMVDDWYWFRASDDRY